MWKKLIDKLFLSKEQAYVITQKPNLPIIVWLVSTIVGMVISGGRASQLLSLVSFGALFIWASLEIVSGLSLFRRLLGAVVLALLMVSRLKGFML